MPSYKLSGCRVDTLFGLYLAPLDRVETWLETAWAMIERGELKIVQERSQEIIEEQDARPYKHDSNGIVRLSMSGPMSKHPTSFQSLFGGVSTMQTRKWLNEMAVDNDVKGVLLDADSFGGTSEGTAEMAEGIRAFAKKKPIHVHAEDKACSAMLWVATQAPSFTCSRGAIIGSMGTACYMYDTSKDHANERRKPVIVSTGEWKTLGAPGRPISDRDKQEIQRFVNEVNRSFREEVVSSRKLSPAQLEEVATARLFVGEDAVRVGLVDRVCTAQQAYDGLLQRIRSGPSDPVPPAPPAVTKGKRIMLSPEQLALAKALPGASQITQETADTTLLQVATDLNRQVADLPNLRQEKQDLTQKVTDLTKQVPPKIDAEVLKGRASLACERIDFLVQKENISPAQATELKKLIMDGDQINAYMVTPNAKGVMPYQPVLDALTVAKPNPVLDIKTGVQPAPRTVPGDPNQQQQPMTTDRRAELLGHAGIAPGNGNGAAK